MFGEKDGYSANARKGIEYVTRRGKMYMFWYEKSIVRRNCNEYRIWEM